MKTRLVVASLFVLLAAVMGVAHPTTLAATPAPGAGFVVIVNVKNSVDALATGEVAKIFMKKAELWPDGTPTAPVDLSEASPARAAFTRAIHRKTVAAVKSYWQQEVFAGRDVPPPEQASDADVVALVKSLPGAIGYIAPGTALAPGVKTIVIR